jgi:hypothetical protein
MNASLRNPRLGGNANPARGACSETLPSTSRGKKLPAYRERGRLARLLG